MIGYLAYRLGLTLSTKISITIKKYRIAESAEDIFLTVT